MNRVHELLPGRVATEKSPGHICWSSVHAERTLLLRQRLSASAQAPSGSAKRYECDTSRFCTAEVGTTRSMPHLGAVGSDDMSSSQRVYDCGDAQEICTRCEVDVFSCCCCFCIESTQGGKMQHNAEAHWELWNLTPESSRNTKRCMPQRWLEARDRDCPHCEAT